MSLEPRDVLTAMERGRLQALRDTLIARGTEMVPLTPYGGPETAEQIATAAWAHAIAGEALEREMLRLTALPLADSRRCQQMFRTALGRLTDAQKTQWALWRGQGEKPRTLAVTVLWRVDWRWEWVMSDTQVEITTCDRILPLLARALWTPIDCFCAPLATWVVEPEAQQQGFEITIGREDAP